MKDYADKNRTERVFQEGELVYLKLQPYRQATVSLTKALKLAPKFYGPFKILEKIGTAAYKLELPSTARIHPTFHVSQLKKHIGDAIINPHLPTTKPICTFEIGPLRVLERRVIHRNNREVYPYLIQWKTCSI